MRTRFIVILLALCLTSALAAYTWTSIAILPFNPVIHNGQGEDFLEEKKITPDEIEAIEEILKKYKQPYRRKEDTILITPKLFFDVELRWNFTTKSKN